VTISDAYGISKHLASPGVSLGEHVRRRQRELGDELQARRASRIDDELNEFKTYILPNKDMVDLTLDVDFDFNYKVSIQK
jgi:hypothetical protein